MPTSTCKPCMGTQLKRHLLAVIDSEEIAKKVITIPECEDPQGIEICECKATRTRSKDGVTRVRTAYQEHISQCMKSKNIKGFGQAPAAMKECAAQWRAQKGV